MTESDPGISSKEKQDNKTFWDKFFHHLDEVSALGVAVDQERVVEIARSEDIEAAKNFLFGLLPQGKPKEHEVFAYKGIINFLMELGYLTHHQDDNPFDEL